MKKPFLYLLLFVAAVSFIYPFLWMASVSFKPPAEARSMNLFSAHFTLENYRAVFQKIPIGRAFLNSLVVAVTTTSCVIFFGSLAGYALSKLRFKGREMIFMIVLLTMMIP